MHFADILYSKSNNIATITINRPDKHNALRINTFEELARATADAAKDPSIGVLVITGAGERAFCAGGDLEMAHALNSEHAMRVHHFDRMLQLSAMIVRMDKPVLCAVNGLAVGGGAELACFCDLVIASDSASFLFNGVRLGGCSWWGAPQLLPLMVGLRKAQQILYLAAPLPAPQAERIGLIHAVTPANELRSQIEIWTNRLLDLSPTGLRMTKAALRSLIERALAPMTDAAEANAAVQTGRESRAAFEAFLAKRAVDWRAFR